GAVERNENGREHASVPLLHCACSTHMDDASVARYKRWVNATRRRVHAPGNVRLSRWMAKEVRLEDNQCDHHVGVAVDRWNIYLRPRSDHVADGRLDGGRASGFTRAR